MKLTLYLQEPCAYASMVVDPYDIMEVSNETGEVVVEMVDGSKFTVKNKITEIADAISNH